jgi:hypothetical protein
MTVATLLLTCLIFLLVGWTGSTYYVTALSIGGIVCIASSNGGTTSQDLKTGFLVGATPSSQQIAILVGAFASALILGPILLVLNDAGNDLHAAPDIRTVESGGYSSERIYAPSFQAIQSNRRSPVTIECSRTNRVRPRWLGSNLVSTWLMIRARLFTGCRKTFQPGLKVDPSLTGEPEKLKGPQANQDTASYRGWHKTTTEGGPAGSLPCKQQRRGLCT